MNPVTCANAASGLSPRTVLVITSGSLGSNPRPLKEALALYSAGYVVTVLSIFETEDRARVDARLLAHTTVRQVELRLPQHGLGCLFNRARVWVVRRAIRFTSWQSILAIGPGPALLRKARSLAADLTIVHNEIPFWVGRRLLVEGRVVAADFEDWYSEDLLPDARRYRPLRLLQSLERELLNCAAYTTTTSNALATALHDTYGGRRPFVLTNCFPLQPLPPERSPNDPPAFIWFSQTIGAGRGLEEFLLAWALTRQPSRLVLIGEPAAGFREKIVASLPKERHEHIEFIAPVSPQDLPEVIARHDIGLALELSSPPSRNLTITNKILQYLNAGLAVVASNTSGQREVFSHTPQVGMLIDLENIASLTANLDTLLADPIRLVEMRKAAREAAENFYCWEVESRTLVRLVATRSYL